MTAIQRERAALVGLFNDSPRHFDPEHALDELAGLASAAGAHAVLRVQQERAKPDPATFLGKGKVAMLAAASGEARVDTVIFDNELSPAQLRNLEDALDRRVVDRTQLILDIFARRARTREGKLQVELAQLKYLMPRLVGSNDALSRPGGGIGTLGPGETKLETDRRRIRYRISGLGKEIDTARRRRIAIGGWPPSTPCWPRSGRTVCPSSRSSINAISSATGSARASRPCIRARWRSPHSPARAARR